MPKFSFASYAAVGGWNGSPFALIVQLHLLLELAAKFSLPYDEERYDIASMSVTFRELIQKGLSITPYTIWD